MSSEQRQGSVAVVTGAARGFGRAFTEALVQAGATVAMVDLDGAACEAAAAEIGARAVAYQADVTDETAINALMAQVATDHGGIDLLINNAGLHAHEYSRPIAEMGIAKVRRLFEVNVMGTLVCTLAAQPHMANREGATIINIASSAAFQNGAYGNSKLAVVGLTMTFARELADLGIRVNAIAPGIIVTDTIRRELAPETLTRIKALQFMKEDGTEQDIVDAMLFLSSPRARFITGETLRVSGGYAAGI